MLVYSSYSIYHITTHSHWTNYNTMQPGKTKRIPHQSGRPQYLDHNGCRDVNIVEFWIMIIKVYICKKEMLNYPIIERCFVKQYHKRTTVQPAAHHTRTFSLSLFSTLPTPSPLPRLSIRLLSAATQCSHESQNRACLIASVYKY